VLLDTNALFLPFRAGFPLDAEIARHRPGARIVVASASLVELARLVERGAPGAPGARALADRYAIEPVTGAGDEAIVALAERLGATVVTADRELQLRLARQGIDVLVPRDRHRLEPRRGRAGGTARPSRSNG
jgi:rRNA-processing protein FCF1